MWFLKIPLCSFRQRLQMLLVPLEATGQLTSRRQVVMVATLPTYGPKMLMHFLFLLVAPPPH